MPRVDLDSELAYFRTKLLEKPERSRASIRATVEDSVFPLTSDQVDECCRRLEASFDVTQERGATLIADHKPWVRERGIEFFYWKRLKNYFLDGRLPPNVVSMLDTGSSEILDYCGNPTDDDGWKRRGMVIGHVQSGKTTNYAALICRAADAGYKVVILLAGLTNLLRTQTQERMDDYFLGKTSVFQVAPEDLSIMGYGDRRRLPAYGTSRDRDFSGAAADTFGVHLVALKEPVLFVTKKNKRTLANLAAWIQGQQPGGLIREPLLLIDDEADNASINTSARPDRVTAINEAIRSLLRLFERSTYIGYTATPFANIFIDPNSKDEMLADDLFPTHFIKVLEPPNNYVGADRMFAEDGDLTAHVHLVADYEDILPLKHKNDLLPSVLPESLRDAVRVFALARALRVLRGQGAGHCSMMINVSRFNNVQFQVHGLVYQYLERLKEAVAVNAGRGLTAREDPEIAALADSFETSYAGLNIDFQTVLASLQEGVREISVIVVNMRSVQTLDYRKHQDVGLHVIAVGGLALSRGLTLEGLTVSYILRNAAASDTLMQMARWFGYRDGYGDLCRLYLPEQSRDHYGDITEAIAELRGEVVRMERLRQTPATFGLKVRESPTGLKITAANKMRTATRMTLCQSYAERFIEGYALRNDAATNSQNLDSVHAFINGLGPMETNPGPRNNLMSSGLMWTGVDGGMVMQLLKAFVFSEAHPDLGRIQGDRSLFGDYVADRYQSELSHWDVAVPAYNVEAGKESYRIATEQRQLVRHASGVILEDESTYKVTRKNKVANPRDEMIGLSPEMVKRAKAEGSRGAGKYCRARTRPLMLIHLFEAGVSSGPPEPRFTDRVVVSLSFCMPGTGLPAAEKTYQVAWLYKQQMLALTTAGNTDEDEELEQVLEHGQ